MSVAARGGVSLALRGHIGTTLRVAVGTGRNDDVSVLVDATLASVTVVGRSYLKHETEVGYDRDSGMHNYREELRIIMDALPGTFTLFQEPWVLGLAPALALDEPPRQKWGVQPMKHAYRYVAIMIALGEAGAIATYYYAGVLLQLGGRIFHFR